MSNSNYDSDSFKEDEDDEYLEIGLGLSLDIDRWAPQPEDFDSKGGTIVTRWRLEDAFRDMFAPGRTFRSLRQLLLVIRELLKEWQIESPALVERDHMVEFEYGVRNYLWNIRFKETRRDQEEIRITESKLEREIPYVIRFRVRQERSKPEFLQVNHQYVPSLY